MQKGVAKAAPFLFALRPFCGLLFIPVNIG
jgi:hypothetical protein